MTHPPFAAPRRMPVLFVGHGSPMNAIEDNPWSRGFAALRSHLPRPAAVLAVSAHWYGDGVQVTGGTRPRTIHDFGGFPEALYQVQYPAPGSPELAARACALLEEHGCTVAGDWGLDHGTWSVLRHVIPESDVPVVQLRMDRRLSPAQHRDLGAALAPLRDERVLILGSGNVVHNLRDAFSQMAAGSAITPDWADAYDAEVRRLLEERDGPGLAALWPDGAHALRAHPTPDHWLPLLYVVGARDGGDEVRFPIEGFDWGSLSMRAVLLG